MSKQQILIQVGENCLEAVLAENSSAQALMEMLEKEPLRIHMQDYANMEKVGPIGRKLPTNDEYIHVSSGDLILYQSNSLVIYYDTNAWSFTRLGKIENADAKQLRSILGKKDVDVVLSLKK